MGDPKARAYAIGVWGAIAVCAPTLGPLVGGFAVQTKGWTWSIWVLMWASGFALVILFFWLPETSGANILCRRAARMRRVTGNPSLRSASEIEVEKASKKVICLYSLCQVSGLSHALGSSIRSLRPPISALFHRAYRPCPDHLCLPHLRSLISLV